MTQTSTQVPVRRGYEIGLAIIVLISVLSFHQIWQYSKSTEQSRRLDQVTSEIQQLELRLREAEAQHLGFVASGEEDFANNYNIAARGFEQSAKNLKILIKKWGFDRLATQQLFASTTQKFEKMSEAMRLRAAGAISDSRRRVASESSAELSRSIQLHFREIEHQIASGLRRKDEDLQNSAKLILLTIIFGTSLAIGLLIFNLRRSQRESENLRHLSVILAEGQAELVRANEKVQVSSQAKSDFLANISHEVRTPMNAISGLSQILRRSGLNGDQLNLVDGIQKSTQALLDVINPVLDVSKIEHEGVNFQMQAGVDLRQLIEESLTIMHGQAELKSIQLRQSLPEHLGYFETDPTRLKQVFLNLLGNAIKFTEKGSVEFRLSVQDVSESRKHLRFEVCDTGIGIPASAKENLFQSFSQSDNSISRKYGGTGLGLSISKAIIKGMKGEIGFESELGKGTTFWFTLVLPTSHFMQKPTPTTNASSASMQIPPDVQDEPHETLGLRALIVEDNPMNQFVLQKFLSELGCDFAAVESGEEALRFLMVDRQFDVIFLDVQMPGMDGFQVTQKIRSQETAGVRPQFIVATTAHAMAGYREKCLEAGMNEYLMKPIQFEILRSLLLPRVPKAQLSSINQKRREKLQATSMGPEMIEIFLTSTPQKVTELEDLLMADQFEHAKEVAHFLKSSASSMAFDLWTEQLQQLENLCERSSKEAKSLWPLVLAEYQQLCGFLLEESLRKQAG